MNQLADAIMALKYAADCIGGKVISIEFDEITYEEIGKIYQYTAPTSTVDLMKSIVTKYLGIEIKKG